MSQDVQNNEENNEENPEEEIFIDNEIDENEIISTTNEILENINTTFRNTRRRQRNSLIGNENPINQRITNNSDNLDRVLRQRVLRQRSRLREELQTTRCNYIISDDRFCTRRRISGSNYCVYHTSVNYRTVERPRRQIHRSPRRRFDFTFSQPRLLDISSPSNPPSLDISSPSNPPNSSSSNPNISIEIENPSSNVSVEIENPSSNVSVDVSSSHLRNLDPDFNSNLNRRRHRIADLPALRSILRSRFRIPSSVSLGVSDNANDNASLSGANLAPEINLFNLISQARHTRDDLAELKEKKDKNGKCCLCQETVVDPKVVLKCDHKYHLKCYMILNTSSEDKYEIMEKCMECQKPIDLNLPEVKDCSICLEKLIDDDIEIELPCKHRFHIYCIQKWVGINKNCPLCRKTF
jgi:hypothetical protein